MKLSELIKDINCTVNTQKTNIDILDLSINSKECVKNSLFFAVKGNNLNGENFIDEAIKNGAVAIIVENDNHSQLIRGGFGKKCENVIDTKNITKEVKGLGIIDNNNVVNEVKGVNNIAKEVKGLGIIDNNNVVNEVNGVNNITNEVKGLGIIDNNNVVNEVKGVNNIAKEVKGVPIIAVHDIKETISKLAYKFYFNKNKKLKLIGVVGTNGKTTTTHILKSIFDNAGYRTGIIGTLGIFYNNKIISPKLTTPDAIDLAKNLMQMSNEGVEYCFMEISAHAIDQKRIQGLKFEGLIFTNCTHDHLDYFKNFDNYKRVKKSIFNNVGCKYIVVNADDDVGLEIIKESKKKVYSYAINNPCDVFAVDVKNHLKKVNFLMNLFDNLMSVSFKITGEFNVLNCLGASTLAYLLKIDKDQILKGLNTMTGVDGRMEYIENYNGADIYVDYAHTPDGLCRTLLNLRKITKNKLILVFGCGGNRDEKKRQIMGEIAGKYADFSVITSDNPRFENGYEIILEIERGIKKTEGLYITIEPRNIAIGYAINMLKKGDVLVVCGKGAETEQEIMGKRFKFNDKECIINTISKLDLSGEII